MQNYKGTWGMYDWSPKNGEGLIHENDRESDLWKMARKCFWGKLLYCSDITADGYLALNDAHRTYRVKPELYKVFTSPVFKYGDVVMDKEILGRIGTIYRIGWHYDRHKEFYNLHVNGKYSTKWCFAEN